MTKLFLIAGAAAMAAAAPLAAKPGHAGGPNKAHVVKVKSAKAKRTWLTACPRGLVWRGSTCIPPGHANRILATGTRAPLGWAYTPWGRVPVDLRTRYDLDPDYRYIYRDNVIYVVDPRTRLIQSIISAVL